MINTLLNHTKPKNQTTNLRDSENNVLKDPRDVAATFNNYFTSIADRLKTQNKFDASDITHRNFMTIPVSSSFFILA